MNFPYIVAEISCNHLGSLGRAMELIDAAVCAHADAVKFQCWKDGMMCLTDYQIVGTEWSGSRMRDLYRDAWTPWDWFPKLFEYAKRVGIECFASVFDHESLRFLENLGCPRYKIASFEIVDLPLISAVARTGKPIIISTGMATDEEVADAMRTAWDGQHTCGVENVTLLKCTSAYPAGADAAHLAAMVDMRGWTDVGLSDHTLGLAVPVAATALGATMIEKHLTLRRADGGPDAAFSSEPYEFTAMVAACREAALALGEMRYGPTESEKASVQFRRSLYWAAPIAAGSYVRREHLRTARPALGAPPSDLSKFLGRRVLRDIAFGEPALLEDVD